MVPFTHVLRDLLQGHGVPAELDDDVVWIPSVDRYARLVLYDNEGRSGLMELHAGDRDGLSVVDTWAAFGEPGERRNRDGLDAFCFGTFHVALAALWGVLETDQVDVEPREVDGRSWDVYLGGMVGRGANLQVPPALFTRVISALDAHLVGGHTHTFRVFLASFDGEVRVVEGLLDGEPDPGLEAAIAGAGWELPPEGYASRRWFGIARLREAGLTAHRLTRTCAR